MLADVNTQRHLIQLRRSLDAQDLGSLVEASDLRLATFREVGLDPAVPDRSLWNYCQEEGWVLFTDDRNDDGPDSLQRTLNDSWQVGHLPIVTPSSKSKIETDRDYRQLVAAHIAELMIDVASGEHRNRPRIFVPLNRA